ncbi:hypothetical protein [Bosea sp. 117]|nr:hypothetical protein [Bosea sp. 117]
MTRIAQAFRIERKVASWVWHLVEAERAAERAPAHAVAGFRKPSPR